MHGAVAWVDAIAPEEAVGICGAKMGRLAELLQGGVMVPKGFTVTVEAFRRYCALSAFDYAAGRVIESGMPDRLVNQKVLDEEQVAAVADAAAMAAKYAFRS